MDISITSQLFQWITGEMSFCPNKYNGSTFIPLECSDLELIVQGHGEHLWKHMMKHVHSMRKVECIRKNILISRFKRQSTFKEISKSDYVGKKINALQELKNIRGALRKTREDKQETEARVLRMNSSLKIAKCKNHYQLSMTEDAERRLILLTMAGEAAQIKADLCNSTENLFILERQGVPSSGFSLQHHPLADSVEDFRDSIPTIHDVLEDPLAPRDNSEYMCFLDGGCSMAKELLDEKLSSMNGELTSRNLSIMSEQSIVTTDSNYWSYMECEEQQFINPKFDAKKRELRKYIAQNATCFNAQQLYKTLQELTSDSIAEMARLRVQEGDSVKKVRLLGNEEDHLKEVKELVSKKMRNLSYAIVSNFVAAAQEKVLACRAEEDLRNLKSEIKSQLKELADVKTGFLENIYELIDLETQQASIGTSIQYLKESTHEMEVEISDKTFENQLKKLSVQLKEMDAEKVHHEKMLESLQREREDIMTSIVSNHGEVQKCLRGIRELKFTRKLEDFKEIPGLLDRETIAFSEYPLEHHMKTTLFSGRTVPDFQLLLNNSMWRNLIVGKESDEAISEAFCHWVKATLGKAPHSSADTICLAAVKANRMIHQLNSARSFPFLFDNQVLHYLAKMSDLQENLDEDEKKWIDLIPLATDINKEHIGLIEKQLTKAETIYKNWVEGAVNKCIPEDIIVSGKNFKQWNYEIQHVPLKQNDCSSGDGKQ